MPLSSGDRLGPYEIVDAIGKGGMGEVWRARDPRLGREVAIKVSAQQFSDRFEREARAIAALNHFNICTLYDVGSNYLVMELIEGPTLADRIHEGPIPLEEALGIAKQIGAALEAAHEKSIVHRDLKPANVKIRPDGSVKVLDFGLAKSTEQTELSPDSPTMMPGTQIGMILGTAGYMAPEQARGKRDLDKRADIWAFGVVLCEMVTGRRPFQGETNTEILAAVIKEEPVWDGVPVQVRRLLRKCLEKDPKRRLRDIGDVWELMDAEDATADPSQLRFGKASWIAVAIPTMLLAGLAFVHFRERPPVAEVSRFQIPIPANLHFPGPTATEEVSPDGRKLAFVAIGTDGKEQLWVRSFDSLDAHPLPGVELANYVVPFFWSYDSRFLAFASADQKLKKVSVSGGPAVALCDAPPATGGSWSAQGVIVFGVGGRGLMQVSAGGGPCTLITKADSMSTDFQHGFPQFLPDGRHFIYYRSAITAGNSGIYLGTIDAKPSEQSSKPLLANEIGPAFYVPSGNSSNGYLLFYREGTVLAQPFNPNKLELSGDPVPAAEHVGSDGIFTGFFSASANGVLTYMAGNTTSSAQLTWLDREGKNVGVVGAPDSIADFTLARDGKRGAVALGRGRLVNLWLFDLAGAGGFTKFTFDSSLELYPVFSPNGSRIVFMSTRDGVPNLYQKLTSGIKAEETAEVG